MTNSVKLRTHLLKLANILMLSFIFYSTCFSGDIKVCLTGKVVSNFPSYGESLKNSVSLSVRENIADGSVIVKDYFYNNKPLEPLNAYRQMIHENCSAIIGFEYLSDLLLVIRGNLNDQVPIFTSYASTTNHDRLPRNVFMFMPTYDFLAGKMLHFLNKRYGKLSDILLVTEINREEMVRYKQVYSHDLKMEGLKFDTYDFMETDTNPEEDLKETIRNKKYKYIFLLSGAVASSRIANTLNDHNVIFIGTENFGSSASQSFYIQLKDKKINAYFIKNIDFLKRYRELAEFESKYKYNYKKDPTILSVYAYDAMGIILKTLSKLNNAATSSIHSINYRGISGLTINKHGVKRSGRYVIISVNKNGYQYEE